MRYAPGHKAETRERILSAAERVFGRQGFAGIGVDGLAQEAGVTSGAFYGHFRSKGEVFRAAAVAGLTRLREGIAAFRTQPGWIRPFMETYLAPPFRQGKEGGCALPSLSGEVARSCPETRAAYQAEMLRVVDELMASLPADSNCPRTRAWAMLALLAGGATLARTVEDVEIGKEIAAAVTDAVIKVSGEGACRG